MSASKYLGFKPGDIENKWYAKYYTQQMTPLTNDTWYALNMGPQALELATELKDVSKLTQQGYAALETGYVLHEDGSMYLAGLTQFKGATPKMLDWWFWWFAREVARYKMWYPRAHVYTQTQAPDYPFGTPDRERYLNTRSYIYEYVGSQLGQMSVFWMDPTQLGFDQNDLDPDNATAVCCRIGLAAAPIDWGYLIHYIRKTQTGCEMRVRLWMGGPYVAPRDSTQEITPELEQQMNMIKKMNGDSAHAMLFHSCQEMIHLASFLPEIYGEYLSRKE